MPLTVTRCGAFALFGLLLTLTAPLRAETSQPVSLDINALILEAEQAASTPSGEAAPVADPAPSGTTDATLARITSDEIASTEIAAPSINAPAIEAPLSEANPYGFKAAWEQSDLVSKGTFVILGIMSAATWYLLFAKLLEQSRLLRQSREVNSNFWQKGSLKDALDSIKTGTPFWYLADSGIKSSRHHKGRITQEVDRSTWVILRLNRAVDEIQSHLQKGLAVLATVGSTAPFVGLFGTVWGIYHALTAIGVSGQASIDKVAGPVGEALIMTALGLAVAVPAVLGYNWLVRRNKAVVEDVRSFAADLHSVLLAGSRVDDEESLASAPSPTASKGALANDDGHASGASVHRLVWA